MSLDEDILAFHVELLTRSGLALEARLEPPEKNVKNVKNVKNLENVENVVISLTGADRDLMLQERAELLEAFQYLANRIFSDRLGEGQRIVVDCDGFRRRKEEELRQIAIKVTEKVKRTGRSEELGLMNPYERRIVHLTVSEDPAVTSSSAGDGYMKRVTIAPA